MEEARRLFFHRGKKSTNKYKTLEYRPASRSDIPFNTKMRSKTLPISKTRSTGKITEPLKNHGTKSQAAKPDRSFQESKSNSDCSKPKSDSSSPKESNSPGNTGNESETYAKPKRKIIQKPKPDTPMPPNEIEDVLDSDLETIMG